MKKKTYTVESPTGDRRNIESDMHRLAASEYLKCPMVDLECTVYTLHGARCYVQWIDGVAVTSVTVTPLKEGK